MSGSVRGAAFVGAALVAGLVVPLPAWAAAVRYEAESATIVNGVVASNHPGFTGTGFVDTTNAVGSAVEFTVTAQAADTLMFRYANGTTADRPATLAVNGTGQGTVSFPPT